MAAPRRVRSAHGSQALSVSCDAGADGRGSAMPRAATSAILRSEIAHVERLLIGYQIGEYSASAMALTTTDDATRTLNGLSRDENRRPPPASTKAAACCSPATSAAPPLPPRPCRRRSRPRAGSDITVGESA